MKETETKSEIIKFRATEKQKCDLTRMAFEYGFTSVSAYILWACLEEDHSEQGAVAMSEALQNIATKSEAVLEKIREGIRQDREAFSVFLDNASKKLDEDSRRNAQRIDDALEKFTMAQKATVREAKGQKKQKGNFELVDLLPMVGLSAAVILAVYLFHVFFR